MTVRAAERGGARLVRMGLLWNLGYGPASLTLGSYSRLNVGAPALPGLCLNTGKASNVVNTFTFFFFFQPLLC